MANQIDLTPAQAPGLHVHIPVGHSASEFNNPTDQPTAGDKAVVATIAPTIAKVRFANPS